MRVCRNCKNAGGPYVASHRRIRGRSSSRCSSLGRSGHRISGLAPGHGAGRRRFARTHAHPPFARAPTSMLARWLSASTRMVTSTPQTPRRNGLRASARSEASDVQQKLLCADRVQHAGEHAQADLEDRKRARISHLSAADRLNTPGLRQRIPTAREVSIAHDFAAESSLIIPRAGIPYPRARGVLQRRITGTVWGSADCFGRRTLPGDTGARLRRISGGPVSAGPAAGLLEWDVTVAGGC